MYRIWHKSYDPEVPVSREYPETCLPLVLERNAGLYPEREAVEFFGTTLTYGRLWDHVLRLANSLRRLGMGRGTKTAIMLPNCPQCVIAYYASLWLGATVIMTNPLYVERELTHQWSDSDAEFLFVLDHFYPKAAKVAAEIGIGKIIATSIRDYLPVHLRYLYPIKARMKKLFTSVPYEGSRVFEFRKLIESGPADPVPCAATPDDLAQLQYTGGTTGTSKGAMLTHRNILANVAQISCWLPALNLGKERFLAVLPFFHAFGLTVNLNLPIYCACSTILMPRFDPDEVIRTIKKRRPTIFPGVPAIYTALLAHPKVDSFDLTSLRFCVTGGAPMPVEVIRRFESITGSIILEGYGLSEASPVTHVNPIEGARKPGSIGIALPDTDCRIVDVETGTRELPQGEVGELTISGPQVMKGYWRNEIETRAVLRNGWLFTGDLATMDDSGYVFIVDRKKDLVISNGYNIYPREIEEVLYEHPGVQDAAVIGVPNDRKGETLKAYIVPKRGESLDAGNILAWCRERLAPYKVPREVEFRDSLPKTMVGKVLRRELRNDEDNRRLAANDG